MSICHDEPFNPAYPALMVTVGNTARKHRALIRDVIVLGRAPGCDIGLTAPDVSSIHCLIHRTPDGLHIRDCQSRAGTHVNGRVIQEALLRDGDTIQVGPFSFQVYLPPEFMEACLATTNALAGTTEPPCMQRLERSRRNLTRLALQYRRRLREGHLLELTQATLAERQNELDHQAEYLRGRTRAYEQRVRNLEEAERALVADRAALERERAERTLQQEQAEQDLAERRAALEKEVEAQWSVWQRYQEEQEQLRKQLDGEELLPHLTEAPSPSSFHEKEARRLDLRRAELDCYARYLWRLRRRLQRRLRKQAVAGPRQLIGIETLGDTPIPGQWREPWDPDASLPTTAALAVELGS